MILLVLTFEIDNAKKFYTSMVVVRGVLPYEWRK